MTLRDLLRRAFPVLPVPADLQALAERLGK
ncbi:MAG: hypothetical protein RL268_194 [Pseudomonadota bacterium]|jgi:hypothetical protein